MLRLKGEGRHWDTWGWGQDTGGEGKWRIQSRVWENSSLYQDLGAGGKHFFGNVQNTFLKKMWRKSILWQVDIFRLSWDMYSSRYFYGILMQCDICRTVDRYNVTSEFLIQSFSRSSDVIAFSVALTVSPGTACAVLASGLRWSLIRIDQENIQRLWVVAPNTLHGSSNNPGRKPKLSYLSRDLTYNTMNACNGHWAVEIKRSKENWRH